MYDAVDLIKELEAQGLDDKAICTGAKLHRTTVKRIRDRKHEQQPRTLGKLLGLLKRAKQRPDGSADA